MLHQDGFFGTSMQRILYPPGRGYALAMLAPAIAALMLTLPGDHGPVTPRPGITGDVRTHPDVPSATAGIRARTVAVWLPPGYEDASNAARRYPVLYMHDGQNVFDPTTAFMGREWHADEVADRLVRDGRIPPIIIVGIWNTPDRVADYTPDQDPDEKRGDHKPQGRGGNGAAYLRWITDELKPMIDRTYRTRPGRADTAIMGSSLGGIISLAAAEQHPATFGRVAAVSPSLWWNTGSVIERWRARCPQPDRLWMCMGDRERAGLDDALRRFEQSIRPGPTGLGDRLHAEVVPGGTHDEPSWSARLDRILVFLFAERGWKDPAPANATEAPR